MDDLNIKDLDFKISNRTVALAICVIALVACLLFVDTRHTNREADLERRIEALEKQVK
jgi:hypothetical protein